MKENEFDFEKNLGKEVYVVGIDYKGVQQNYFVYFNLDEATNHYNILKDKNTSENYSYTLEKCIVKESELEIQEIIF